jgi:hypothetical protein
MNMNPMICVIVQMCNCLAYKHGQNIIFKNCKPRDGKIEKGIKRGFPEEIHNQSNKESPPLK